MDKIVLYFVVLIAITATVKSSIADQDHPDYYKVEVFINIFTTYSKF